MVTKAKNNCKNAPINKQNNSKHNNSNSIVFTHS
jgi:hypothetical protein